MKKSLCAVFVLLLTMGSLLAGSSFAGLHYSGGKAVTTETVCFFELSNEVESHFHRWMYVLLSKEDFTDERLAALLEQLSQRYPMPERMDVMVFSAVEQVERTFADGRPSHPRSQLIDHFDPIPYNKYAHAYLMRQDGNSLFRYNVAGGETKTVIVRGVDPSGNR